MQTILILTANPQGISRLRLDQEVGDIKEGLERAKKRDQFVVESKLAVRLRDIQRAILDINPSIVHFCGHGTGNEGLVFEDETGSAKLVDGEALAGLFALFAEQVECVVLNGCYSEVQADAIAQHINYVIGMKKAIPDKAAIEFAVGFYDALGAGRSVEFAHKLACAAIRLAGIPKNPTSNFHTIKQLNLITSYRLESFPTMKANLKHNQPLIIKKTKNKNNLKRNSSNATVFLLVREYCRLAKILDPSEKDIERISAILELAQYDSELNYLINEADHLIAYELGLSGEFEDFYTNFSVSEQEKEPYLQ